MSAETASAPLLTIVTITRNRSRRLKRALESVLLLHLRDWEYIVINDGSTDETAAIVFESQRICKEIRYYEQAGPRGLAWNRSWCVSLARGRYIAFLDDDDFFLPGRFDRHIPYLEAHPSCSLVYSRVDMRGKFGIESEIYPREPVLDFLGLLEDNRIQVAGVTIRADSLRKAGGFCEGLESCDDYDMWLRLSRLFPIAFIPETVGCYIWHDSNMSLDTERDYRSLMRILSRLFADGLSKEENLKIFRRAAALNSRRSRCGSKGGPIHASVIVCTRGRAGSLKETLLSLSAQRVPEGVNIEIVIVDNGSSDGTAAAAGTFSGESPFPVKYFLESGDGLSAARRRAVREAAGELLLFTDDDILVSPEWLFNHWNAFRETGADILGGPVLPLWESAPPRWILESGAARSRLALLDRGGSLFTTHSFDGDLIYGANMALRKSSALAAGGFSASYDRKKVQRGGDTELYERMMRSGFKAAYVPEARVLHQIPSGRLRKSYLCKVSYHGGKAKARLFGESYGFSWKKAAVDFKKAVRGLFSPAAASTDALLFLSESAGYLRERWALQAERRPLFAGTPERTPSKP